MAPVNFHLALIVVIHTNDFLISDCYPHSIDAEITAEGTDVVVTWGSIIKHIASLLQG
jgi:hypothetical protein